MKEILVISLFVTIIMFIAHALPINENVIEKNIINAKTKQDKCMGYGIALIYYAMFIAVGLYIYKRQFKTML